MKVGTLASTIAPQCAPPSPSPSSVAGIGQHLADRLVIADDVARHREEQEIVEAAVR